MRHPRDVLETAQKPADKLKAAEMVIHLLGFDHPEKDPYGWGVGKTTAEDVVIEQAHTDQIKAMRAQFLS